MNRTIVSSSVVALVLLLAGCWGKPGTTPDEAKSVGRSAVSFTAADEDYFHDMDGGIALSSDEIKGRDTWLVWSGGNDRLWDHLSNVSFGNLDLLKALSSYPSLATTRDNRWETMGLVNEPCFKKATGPNPDRFGLWLDVRVQSPQCPSDPFENTAKYPGVAIGARGKTVPLGSYFGFATGVVGLRLFPNPNFDDKAAKAWDPQRYYSDPSYYQNKDLIKPYRVGMSCGFCHVGPSPVNPPADPNNPAWSNLSSTAGAQYMWIDRIFAWRRRPSDFISQLFQTWRPGTLDTSLVSTDNINNPRTMNAIYAVLPRLGDATRFGRETLAGGGLDNRQFNDFVASGPLTTFFEAPATVLTPHVLKDGADSVGVLGALNRVYVNIGTDSEEWLLHFNPVVGGKPISPLTIKDSRENSSYYAATENQTLNEALFLIRASQNLDHLSDAAGGKKYLTTDLATLTRGKIVFAENCARCHSSKLPQPAPGLDPNGCVGPQYLDCFKRYFTWTRTPDFKSKMRGIVLDPNFLQNNYLSADFRVPVTYLHTNACSPLATNAIADNIWDNYSSQSYKDLPSVGSVTWYDPYTGEPHQYEMPAGGRGYTRVPSLIALWSTAPYLLNNSVGPFDQNPSIGSRMRVFEASIRQMLWPQLRAHDSLLGTKVPGLIDRTTQPSYLTIAKGYLPDLVQKNIGAVQKIFPKAFSSGPDSELSIGPIPAGTPVGLLSNIRLLSEDLRGNQLTQYERNKAKLVAGIIVDLLRLPANASDQQARKVFANIYPALLTLSKCPDYVVNRGHYFGTGYREPGEIGPPRPGLSDQDKYALIEFLKTF
ncbi:MAG TPA: hypothetical protein VHR97_07650 [Candidatus Baltobacteraceae bacterium]|jgi:hypothetical protein|nr:hypothetical protein [Candidatus Baltobacteraceae bacterium]